MKRVVCKYCGVAHECAGRMSNEERARHAALARVEKAMVHLKVPPTRKTAQYDDGDGDHD